MTFQLVFLTIIIPRDIKKVTIKSSFVNLVLHALRCRHSISLSIHRKQFYLFIILRSLMNGGLSRTALTHNALCPAGKPSPGRPVHKSLIKSAAEYSSAARRRRIIWLIIAGISHAVLLLLLLLASLSSTQWRHRHILIAPPSLVADA